MGAPSAPPRQPGYTPTQAPAQPGWQPAPSPQAVWTQPGYAPAYPPGYAPVAPPPKSNRGLIAAVVVIVALVVVIGIPAMLYIMVASTGPSPTSTPPTIILQAGSWAGGNLSVTVQSVAGSQSVDPAALTYILLDANGNSLYAGPEDARVVTGATTVNVVYLDNLDPGRASAGDAIRVSVTPPTSNEVNGARLSVFFQGSQVGTVTLP